jgi:hypothetical protein
MMVSGEAVSQLYLILPPHVKALNDAELFKEFYSPIDAGPVNTVRPGDKFVH